MLKMQLKTIRGQLPEKMSLYRYYGEYRYRYDGISIVLDPVTPPSKLLDGGGRYLEFAGKSAPLNKPQSKKTRQCCIGNLIPYATPSSFPTSGFFFRALLPTNFC
jgi:hypothetical protein